MNTSELKRLFTALPDRKLRSEGIIIGEGRLVAERVAAYCEPLALLAVPELAAYAAALSGERCPVVLLPEAEIAAIAGYPFHRGLLIAARRPESPSLSVDALRDARRLVVLPAIADAENLGAIARTAAALGWDALVMGPLAADPYGRRALRCSMGATLTLPQYRLDSGGHLALLAENDWTLVAATVETDAQKPEFLRGLDRLALVLGHEHTGVPAEVRHYCHQAVAIPQSRTDVDGVDSLNVAAAAAILLWEGRA